MTEPRTPRTEALTLNPIYEQGWRAGYEAAEAEATAPEATEPAGLNPEQLAAAICDYAGDRQRLVFPLSRVRTVAYAIGGRYEAIAREYERAAAKGDGDD